MLPQQTRDKVVDAGLLLVHFTAHNLEQVVNLETT